MVIAGKDVGKKGKVTQVLPKLLRVVVDGVNTMTKNIKSRSAQEKGQRIQFNGPIHISNVMLIDPKTGHPTRVGTSIIGDKHVRRSVRSQQPLS